MFKKTSFTQNIKTMIKEFLKHWDNNKDKLEEYIRTSDTEFYYDDLVKLIFEIILQSENFDTSKMTIIDHGNYQGLIIYIVPKDIYSPYIWDYVYTFVGYGSCSYCDTIHNILTLKDKEQKVREYMSLCLHIFQNMNWLARSNND